MTVEDLIEEHEGRETATYLDAVGHPTIGIGHNLDASPLPPGWSSPLTDDQVDQLFATDLAKVTVGLRGALPWFSRLDSVRQAVLQDMAFNMGTETLLTFKHTLGCVEAGNWQAAHDGMLASLWAKQVPKRAAEDAQMMLTGQWPDEEVTPTEPQGAPP